MPTTQASASARRASRPRASRPAILAPRRDEIVRPFQASFASRRDPRRRSRSATPATKPICGGERSRQGSIEQRAGVEIAGRRDPDAARAGRALRSVRSATIHRRPGSPASAPRRASSLVDPTRVEAIDAPRRRIAIGRSLRRRLRSKQRLRRGHRRVGQRRGREHVEDDQRRRQREHDAGGDARSGRKPWPARRNT